MGGLEAGLGILLHMNRSGGEGGFCTGREGCGWCSDSGSHPGFSHPGLSLALGMGFGAGLGGMGVWLDPEKARLGLGVG